MRLKKSGNFHHIVETKSETLVSTKSEFHTSLHSTMLAPQFILLLASIQITYAHGNLWSIGQQASPEMRGISNLSSNTTLLNYPTTSSPICRGEAVSSTLTPFPMDSDNLTLQMAIKTAHAGSTCNVSIESKSQAPIILTTNGNCVTTSGVNTTQISPIPAFFFFTWTFPIDRSKITCPTNDCFLRWTWTATVATGIDYFENCIDVSINSPAPSPSGKCGAKKSAY